MQVPVNGETKDQALRVRTLTLGPALSLRWTLFWALGETALFWLAARQVDGALHWFLYAGAAAEGVSALVTMFTLAFWSFGLGFAHETIKALDKVGKG